MAPPEALPIDRKNAAKHQALPFNHDVMLQALLMSDLMQRCFVPFGMEARILEPPGELLHGVPGGIDVHAG